MSWISLCEVSKKLQNDNKMGLVLRRIADLNSATSLNPVVIETNKEQIGKNRRFIFRQDGPREEHMIGLWSWNEYQDSFKVIHASSKYRLTDVPTELFGVKVYRTEEITRQLRTGIVVPKYLGEKFFLYGNRIDSEQIEGILCSSDQFNEIEELKDSGYKKIILKDDIDSLPVYTLGKNDFIQWKDAIGRYVITRRVAKTIRWGKPQRYLYIKLPDAHGAPSDRLGKLQCYPNMQSPSDLIQKYVLNQISLQKFSPEKREEFKTFFKNVLQTGIRKNLQETYHVPEATVELWLLDFTRKVNKTCLMFENDDILLLADIIKNSKDLQEKLQNVIKLPQKDSLEELNRQKELVKQEELRLKQIKADIGKYEKEVQEKEQTCKELNQDIDQYTELRDSIESETKRKIEDARQHMGRFLTEISAFTAVMPTGMSNHRAEGWSLKGEEKTTGKDVPAVKSSSWEDVRETIGRNLEMAGVAPEWCNLAGSYLYAAYIHHMDLLLAGPHGRAIVNALALAVEGKKAVCLSCHGEPDVSVIQQLKEMQEPVIVVENPFHPEWLSRMGECKAACPDTLFIWLHPFTEDLVVEPLGLFNYVLPVFTEFFVNGDEKPEEMQRSLQSDAFEAYQEKKPVEIPLSLMKPFKISMLTRTHLKQLIATAAGIMDERTAAGKLEFLMGKLPFALLTNERRYDESECSGSKELRKLAKQYLEEAD